MSTAELSPDHVAFRLPWFSFLKYGRSVASLVRTAKGLSATFNLLDLPPKDAREKFLSECAPRVRGMAIAATSERIDGEFMRRFPQLKKNLVDLLIGDVFKPEVNQIFDAMSQEIPLPEPVPLEQPVGATP